MFNKLKQLFCKHTKDKKLSFNIIENKSTKNYKYELATCKYCHVEMVIYRFPNDTNKTVLIRNKRKEKHIVKIHLTTQEWFNTIIEEMESMAEKISKDFMIDIINKTNQGAS